MRQRADLSENELHLPYKTKDPRQFNVDSNNSMYVCL